MTCTGADGSDGEQHSRPNAHLLGLQRPRTILSRAPDDALQDATKKPFLAVGEANFAERSSTPSRGTAPNGRSKRRDRNFL